MEACIWVQFYTHITQAYMAKTYRNQEFQVFIQKQENKIDNQKTAGG